MTCQRTPPPDRRATDAGTNLIELLVVLAILGLLAAIAAPQMARYFAHGQTNAADTQIVTLSLSLNLFRADVGRYPTTGEGLEALLKAPATVDSWSGPYLRGPSALLDPWGHPFVYRSGGAKGFELFSRGSGATSTADKSQ